ISATAVPRPYHRRSAGLPVCSTPWPATVFDVALAFLSLVLLSPVLLDLARKSACPTCALYCGDPHGPMVCLLRLHLHPVDRSPASVQQGVWAGPVPDPTGQIP